MDLTVLIAEDEPKLLAILCDYFESKGDAPIPAKDGLEALELAESREFDGVLLDIMMPGLNGLSVCRALRKNSDVPIIFLTALSDEEDKLLGYELGADDYMTKPFSMGVLYAKLTALIKRSRGSMRMGDRLEAGELVHVIADAHIYDRHVPVIEELISREPKDAPKFIMDESIDDFYKFTRDSFRVEGYDYHDFTTKIPVAV